MVYVMTTSYIRVSPEKQLDEQLTTPWSDYTPNMKDISLSQQSLNTDFID